MSYGRKTTIQSDEHDQKIAEALKAEKLAEAKIPPTILIGIGGTGAKALQVLRQEMLDYYGTVRTERMQYIELDTEVAAQDPTLSSLKADPRKDKIRFDDQEFLSLSGTPVSSLVDNAMYIDGIKQWWDPNAKGESGRVNLSDGAAQIRPLGRLTYFHFRNTIRQKIQHAQGIVNNSVDGASGIEVFIVSGAAGGTGSSMTFDVCADVRSIIGDCKITLVVCCASLHQLQDET